MFTKKDVEARSIFVVNCLDHTRSLRVVNGELMLEETDGEKKKTLTKFPFQKILALFVIGSITVTTPLMEKCKKFNVSLVVMKPNLRPVFFFSDAAEANFLLRQRQIFFSEDDLTVAKFLMKNKISNEIVLLQKTRRKDDLTLNSIAQCKSNLEAIETPLDYNGLMGLEGTAAKSFFAAYFQELGWAGRKPRTKCDAINVTLDIGYTILFNFMEAFIRMFGFDLYVGVYHRLWFKRKSLVCDLMEPFRCIIDHAVLLAFKRKQFKTTDFEISKHEFFLKRECAASYYQVFYNALIDYRLQIFKFVQSYYRCFMGRKSMTCYQPFQYE